MAGGAGWPGPSGCQREEDLGQEPSGGPSTHSACPLGSQPQPWGGYGYPHPTGQDTKVLVLHRATGIRFLACLTPSSAVVTFSTTEALGCGETEMERQREGQQVSEQREGDAGAESPGCVRERL